MPKAAIFFSIILLSSLFSNSYGFTSGDLVYDNFVPQNNDNFFESDIVDVSPDFFTQNNLFWGLIKGGFNFNVLSFGLGTAFLGVLTAFFFHEIAHKLMAQKYGLWAEYRMFPKGLRLALLLGVFTPIVFAAPGAVMFRGQVRAFEMGKIAVAGPLANIIIAMITLPLYLFVFFDDILLGRIVLFICFINALLATFNLLPLGPLDGAKVVRWNATVWIILFIIAVGFMMAIFPYISILQ